MDKNQILQKIDKFYKQKNWQEMEKVCTQGLKHFPNSASTYYNRAIAKAELGNLEEAKQDLEKSLEIRFSQEAKQLLEKIKEHTGNQTSTSPLLESPSQLLNNEFSDLKELFHKDVPKKIDRHQIIEEIGRGGMGCVYKAYDPQMNKHVALKMMLSGMKEKELKRFIAEAKAMAKFSHSNIVRVYDVGEDGGNSFIVMDYVEGQSLKEYLQKTPLKIRAFCQLMVKIGRAIAYAHDKEIIHRDLKPANIMLDENLEPQVMDFGLAKVVNSDNSLSKKDVIVGTPQYMSPEQARGLEVNHLTDVYALGAIFYEMLAGKPMIKGATVGEIVFKVIHKEPDLLRKVNDKLARDLETICAKAIDKNVNKRYQSASDFVDDINRFLNGELISARPYGILEKGWRRLQQNRIVALTGIIGLFLLVVGVWMFEKRDNVQVYLYLAKAKGWQEKADREQVTDKKMQMYMEASSFLEKALELSPHDLPAKSKLIKVQKKMGMLAREQKDFLLSFTFLKRCKSLGGRNIDKLLNELEQDKNKQEKRDRQFIAKAMEKMKKLSPATLEEKELANRYIDRYVFTIVKMQKPYVIGMLIPCLNSENKWQRLLAIKALGSLGDTFTLFKNKDSVEWLLDRLKKLTPIKERKINSKNKKINQEIEKIIWALGLLKDIRAKELVHQVRYNAGKGSLLWDRTKFSYKSIPQYYKKAILPKDFLQRGLMKKEKGDLAGAIIDYDQAIKINSEYVDAYIRRGITWHKKGELEKAISDYNHAIKLSPQSAVVYNNRGLTWHKKGEWEKAIYDFTQAIKINPRYENAYWHRGGTWREKGKLEKAILDFNKAVKINPLHAGAFISL